MPAPVRQGTADLIHRVDLYEHGQVKTENSALEIQRGLRHSTVHCPLRCVIVSIITGAVRSGPGRAPARDRNHTLIQCRQGPHIRRCPASNRTKERGSSNTGKRYGSRTRPAPSRRERSICIPGSTGPVKICSPSGGFPPFVALTDCPVLVTVFLARSAEPL